MGKELQNSDMILSLWIGNVIQLANFIEVSSRAENSDCPSNDPQQHSSTASWSALWRPVKWYLLSFQLVAVYVTAYRDGLRGVTTEYAVIMSTQLCRCEVLVGGWGQDGLVRCYM